MKNYFIASQDKDLRMRVGSVPGTPIIYLNKVTLVLEPPSQDSRDFSKEVTSSFFCPLLFFLSFCSLLLLSVISVISAISFISVISVISFLLSKYSACCYVSGAIGWDRRQHAFPCINIISSLCCHTPPPISILDGGYVLPLELMCPG